MCVGHTDVTPLEVFLGELMMLEKPGGVSINLSRAATAHGRAPTVLGRAMAQKKRFGEGAKEP